MMKKAITLLLIICVAISTVGFTAGAFLGTGYQLVASEVKLIIIAYNKFVRQILT